MSLGVGVTEDAGRAGAASWAPLTFLLGLL